MCPFNTKFTLGSHSLGHTSTTSTFWSSKEATGPLGLSSLYVPFYDHPPGIPFLPTDEGPRAVH